MGKLSGMPRLFNGRLKYLFLAPIVLLIGFMWFYQNTLAEIQRQDIAEKMAGKRMAIELISSAVNGLNHLEPDAVDYPEFINGMIDRIYDMDNTFVMQYDHKLSAVSKRTPAPGYMPAEPLRFPEFVGAVTRGESGEIELPYYGGPKTYPMYLYYKWVTYGEPPESRSLLVVGVVREGMAEPFMRLTTGVIVKSGITFLINMAFVVLLSHLGFIYASRRGKKWRSPL